MPRNAAAMRAVPRSPGSESANRILPARSDSGSRRQMKLVGQRCVLRWDGEATNQRKRGNLLWHWRDLQQRVRVETGQHAHHGQIVTIGLDGIKVRSTEDPELIEIQYGDLRSVADTGPRDDGTP